MLQALKYICLNVMLFTCVLHADFPYPPDFSLDMKHLEEPGALSESYSQSVPNSWEYYKYTEEKAKDIIPNEPMVMEICAIYDTTEYIYHTKEELMLGCNRGDIGLLHLVLQPYQYMPKLHSFQTVNLVPDYTQNSINPRIVIYYKMNESTNDILTSIEFGDIYKDNVFFINERAFKYNEEIVSQFGNLIYEVSDTIYLPETLLSTKY